MLTGASSISRCKNWCASLISRSKFGISKLRAVCKAWTEVSAANFSGILCYASFFSVYSFFRYFKTNKCVQRNSKLTIHKICSTQIKNVEDSPARYHFSKFSLQSKLDLIKNFSFSDFFSFLHCLMTFPCLNININDS